PGAVLIQTQIDGDELSFHYYGTKDERKEYIFGPYLTNYRGAPAARYTTSSNIPVGSTQELSGIHPGVDATWFRLVEKPEAISVAAPDGVLGKAAAKEPEGSKLVQEWQTFFSHYQARGLWVVKGVSAEEKAAEANPEAPAAPKPAEFEENS